MAPACLVVIALAVFVSIIISAPLGTLFNGTRPGYGGQPVHTYALEVILTVNVLLVLAVALHVYMHCLPSTA
jgi:hypothetical protein